MPRAITPLCTASKSRLASKTTSTHIWISDDQLSETFHAFARGQRRHGSNTPGPLEARRRSAKRKATSLAHLPTGPPIDPVLLFGAQPQEAWWSKPESPAQPPKEQAWPWPFTTNLSHTAILPPPKPPALTRRALEPQRSHISFALDEDKRGIEAYRMELHKISTIQSVLKLLEKHSVNLVRHPHVARETLSHMLAKSWSMEQITEFLLEPKTNPIGSANHVHMLTESEEYAAVFKYLLRNHVLLRAARLGLLSVEDVRESLFAISKLGNAMLLDGVDSATLCISLIDAVEASQVLKLHDLGQQFVKEWLSVIQTHAYHPSTPQLLWRLIVSLDPSEPVALGSVWRASLSMIKTRKAHISGLKNLIDFTLSKSHETICAAIFHVTCKLQNLAETAPEEFARSVESEAANSLLLERLVARVSNVARPYGLGLRDRKRQVQSKALSLKIETRNHDLLQHKPFEIELWYVFLSGLGAAGNKPFALPQSTFEGWVAGNQSQKAGTGLQARLFTSLWIVMALSVRSESALIALNTTNIGMLLKSSFTNPDDIREGDILISTLDFLRTCRLPAKNKLFRRMHHLTGGILSTKGSYMYLQRQLADLREVKLADLREKLYYRSARFHFLDLLRDISESTNENMADFEHSCLLLIRETKGSINLVFRLLSHNAKLKFALREASNRVAHTAVLWQREGPDDSASEALGGYAHRRLVDMINNFAMECAETKHLSPRNSLRKVYWLFVYLRSHGAPILPQMLQALWHATIQRPANPTYGRVKWLYALVEGSAGTEEAAKLLDTYLTPGECANFRRQDSATSAPTSSGTSFVPYMKAAQAVLDEAEPAVEFSTSLPPLVNTSRRQDRHSIYTATTYDQGQLDMRLVASRPESEVLINTTDMVIKRVHSEEALDQNFRYHAF